jgi:hypothetical protein
MRKIASMMILLSAFSFPAFAGGQGQEEDEDTVPHYVCYAKDYENLWHQGVTSPDSHVARASALKQCRQNSLAPETCQVMSCETVD